MVGPVPSARSKTDLQPADSEASQRKKVPFLVSNLIRGGLFVLMLLMLFGIVGGKKGFVVYHFMNPFNLFNLQFETPTILLTVILALGLALQSTGHSASSSARLASFRGWPSDSAWYVFESIMIAVVAAGPVPGLPLDRPSTWSMERHSQPTATVVPDACESARRTLTYGFHLGLEWPAAGERRGDQRIAGTRNMSSETSWREEGAEGVVK